jgi:hypothetical protein
MYPCDLALVAWSMIFFNSIAHPTALFRCEPLAMTSVYTSEYPQGEDYALLSVLSRQRRRGWPPRWRGAPSA